MQGTCDRHGPVTAVCPRCAGAAGGKIGGKSVSPRRLAACRVNARRARDALRQKRAAPEAMPTGPCPSPRPRLPEPAAPPQVYEPDNGYETHASPPGADPLGNRIRQEFEAAIEASRHATESWTKRR